MTQSGQAKVYAKQGATEFTIDAGGRLNAASGEIVFPGALARGYDALTAIGAKTTATSSGISAITGASGTTALVGMVNVGVSGPVGYRWATNNGFRLYFAPWRVPNDLSTADPLYVIYTGENTSGATRDCNVIIHGGVTATANLGTTGALTSTPIERTITVASGSIPSSGSMTVAWAPTSGATGAVYLYGVGISYAKKTS